MLNLCGKVIDNDISKEELLQNIEIEKMSKDDASVLPFIISKTFGIDAFEAFKQLVLTSAQLGESVKAVDKRNGDIYGFLIFCKHPIIKGSPICEINSDMANFLDSMPSIHGFIFALDERIRGCGIDKKMLRFNMDYLSNFSYIWCAVEESLKSNHYWERLGFKEILSIPQAKFYILPLDKSRTPYIYKMVDLLNNAKD
jgi:ribosomal protein S18 acetylase RimI-like enzyme